MRMGMNKKLIAMLLENTTNKVENKLLMPKTEKQQTLSSKLKYHIEKPKRIFKRLIEKIKTSKSVTQDFNFDSYEQLESKRTKHTLRRNLF